MFLMVKVIFYSFVIPVLFNVSAFEKLYTEPFISYNLLINEMEVVISSGKFILI